MKRLTLGLALLLTLTATGTAQTTAAPEVTSQAAVFRSGASLVALSVTVIDAGRRFVSGLNATDFAVFEDGVQQQVRFFEAADVPLDLIILLDTSSSMSDKMDVVHQAATGFVRTLRSCDRGAVVSFADGVSVVQPLTGDRALLESAVNQTHAKGATALNNALYVALKQFGRSARQGGQVRRQAIALLSDGEDTSSLITFDDVMALARQSGVSVYTIGLQSRPPEPRSRRYFSESEYSLKSLAEETGGQAFFPLTVNDLNTIYGSIASELASQYSIGYSPSNTRSDGRYRRIVVRITSRPDLRPKARTGYTAQEPSMSGERDR